MGAANHRMVRRRRRRRRRAARQQSSRYTTAWPCQGWVGEPPATAAASALDDSDVCGVMGGVCCVQIRGLIFEAGFLTFEQEGAEEAEEELPPPVKPTISWCVRAYLPVPLLFASSSLCGPSLPRLSLGETTNGALAAVPCPAPRRQHDSMEGHRRRLHRT